MKRYGKGAVCVLGMLILIFDGAVAAEAISDGIELCLKSVIPSLFPFMILSAQMVDSFRDVGMMRRIAKGFGITQNGASIPVAGLLGGYPTGAVMLNQAYDDGAISKRQAQIMASVCNNAGPAFIFGMVAPKMAHPGDGWWLWGIQICSALAAAMALPAMPENGTGKISEYRQRTWAAIMKDSLGAMATVCGWIIVFRVVLHYIQRQFAGLDSTVTVLLQSITELANGCCNLDLIDDPTVRFVVAAVSLAFGGLCVAMQTAGVAPWLSMKQYLIGKLLQSAIAAAMAVCVVMGMDWVFILIFSLLTIRKIRGRNFAKAGV